jgi:dTDP-4-amino-4,6-dideoxygalactose transaminase
MKYVNEVHGYNSRLDPIQAAVLRVKLKHLDAWNARRKTLAKQYMEGLADSGLVLPHVPEWAEPAWHLLVVRSKQRDGLQQHLADAGIGSLIHYPIPPHKQQAYAQARWPADAFPLASMIANEVLSLPMGPHLAAPDVARVIAGLLHAPV